MSMQSSRRIVWTLFAAVALSSAAAQAKSDNDVLVQNKVVKFTDLDLSRSGDAEKLYARLRSAADKVCVSDESHRNLKMRALERRCVDAALTDAVEKVNHPALAALHDSSKATRVAQRASGGERT